MFFGNYMLLWFYSEGIVHGLVDALEFPKFRQGKAFSCNCGTQSDPQCL